MSRILTVVVCLSAWMSVHAANRSNSNYLTTTYQSYNPDTGNFDLTQFIEYQLPDPSKFGPGPYPLFIHTVGTFEKYDDTLAETFVSQMALRGFLAATVEYDNNESVQLCSTFTPRAQGIFDATRTTSAVSVLCAMGSANCSKGITTTGVSQGGFMAVLAKNYAPNVKAAYVLGMSDYSLSGVNYSACVDKNVTAIPADRLTIVNGAADQFFGGQDSVEAVSGFTCAAGSIQCWSPDGSGAGWYIVQNSQVLDGVADHCYYLNDKTNPGGCFGIFDTGWYPPSTYNWSLKSNLDWLATFGTKRVFSKNGL